MFYFAYGSNADPERFRSRVGPWRSVQAAWLDGHRLRFADSVQSEGGGGAVLDADEAGTVAGVLFEIGADQMAAMDRTEFDPARDTSGIGVRVTRQVRTANGEVEAEVYTVNDDGGSRAPSERYLGHILAGLAAAGHSEADLDRVRRVAEQAG